MAGCVGAAGAGVVESAGLGCALTGLDCDASGLGSLGVDSGATLGAAPEFFCPVDGRSAGFAGWPVVDGAGTPLADGFLTAGAVAPAVPEVLGAVLVDAGLATGFAPAGAAPGTGVALAGFSGTDGRRCARMSAART